MDIFGSAASEAAEESGVPLSAPSDGPGGTRWCDSGKRGGAPSPTRQSPERCGASARISLRSSVAAVQQGSSFVPINVIG